MRGPRTVRDSFKAHLKSGIARYQWTNQNNIILAKNGSRFLRELDIDLAVLGAEKANVNFTPQVRNSNRLPLYYIGYIKVYIDRKRNVRHAKWVLAHVSHPTFRAALILSGPP